MEFPVKVKLSVPSATIVGLVPVKEMAFPLALFVKTPLIPIVVAPLIAPAPVIPPALVIPPEFTFNDVTDVPFKEVPPLLLI